MLLLSRLDAKVKGENKTVIINTICENVPLFPSLYVGGASAPKGTKLIKQISFNYLP